MAPKHVSVDEARSLKAELEKRLVTELGKYEDITGAKIISIHVTRVELYIGEQPIIRVDLRIEL